MAVSTRDPRLHAYRADLADKRLRGAVSAPRYIEGRAARVVVGATPVRQSPSPRAECVTFYHYGEELLVFDSRDGYAWCQSQFDGYVGYCAARDIAPGLSRPTHFVQTLGSYLYEAPDLRAVPGDFLPRHGAVTVVEKGLWTRGTEYAQLETGQYLPICCLSTARPCSTDLAAAAGLYLGCPYLWGGRSCRGIDCSGLVQSAFRDLGLAVPRDTDMQQGVIGEAVAIADPGDLRRGDLLYLPGHVLIAGGDGTVIHADGASMTVRRDDLAGLMRARRLDWPTFTLRRHEAACGRPDRRLRRIAATMARRLRYSRSGRGCRNAADLS